MSGYLLCGTVKYRRDLLEHLELLFENLTVLKRQLNLHRIFTGTHFKNVKRHSSGQPLHILIMINIKKNHFLISILNRNID